MASKDRCLFRCTCGDDCPSERCWDHALCMYHRGRFETGTVEYKEGTGLYGPVEYV